MARWEENIQVLFLLLSLIIKPNGKSDQMVPASLWVQLGLLGTLPHCHLPLPVSSLTLQLNVLISPDPDYCHQLTLPEQTVKSASETRLYQLAPPKGNAIPVYKLASMGTIHHSPPGAFVCTPNPGHRTVSVPEQTSSCKCEGVPSSEDTGINTYESPADPAYSCQHTKTVSSKHGHSTHSD